MKKRDWGDPAGRDGQQLVAFYGGSEEPSHASLAMVAAAQRSPAVRPWRPAAAMVGRGSGNPVTLTASAASPMTASSARPAG